MAALSWRVVPLALAVTLAAAVHRHVGRIDGWGSFNGIYPRQHEHIIVLANSEATSVLDIGTTLAALTLG